MYAAANPVYYIDPSGFIFGGSTELSAAEAIREDLAKMYFGLFQDAVNYSASYLPGGQSLVVALAVLDGLSLIGDLPHIIRAVESSIGMLQQTKKLRQISKHLPGTQAAITDLRKQGSNHVFKDRATMDYVTRELMEKGEYTGYFRDHHRFVLEFPQSIGTRNARDGTTMQLRWAELKITEEGYYHVVPRNSPAS